jgi:hypothetical protein
MAKLHPSQTIPFQDSRPLLGTSAELRARAKMDGYLFFRGLLPPADVLSVRRALLVEVGRSGWLDDAGSEDARVRSGVEPVLEGDDPAWRDFYVRAYRRPELHALNRHPILSGTFEALFGEAVLAHPRVIARVMFPNTSRFTTPPHQDHFHIGGTPETWTAWIPLGDCPVELGGLAIAIGSHQGGDFPVERAEGAGGHAVACRPDWVWATGAFRAGDVLAFHSHTVHQADDNASRDCLRLSCDFRFQALSAPVDPSSLRPHRDWLTWEEVRRE